jgi:hypothetical protein
MPDFDANEDHARLPGFGLGGSRRLTAAPVAPVRHALRSTCPHSRLARAVGTKRRPRGRAWALCDAQIPRFPG